MEELSLKLPGSSDFFTQEAYKVLRTNIQFCGPDIKVIAVTSCYENEGKTTVALHLAKSFAELGKKVLLIDVDMRKSVMAGRNTTAKDTLGLSEVLTGMNTLQECLYPTQFKNLQILFSGQYPPNPVELISGKYFAELIANARKSYDYIILDTPPLGRVIDAAVASTLCDGTVLVMGGNRVRIKQAKEVVNQLRMSNCKILGVIRNNINKVKGSKYGRYAYYGNGYYGYSDKYGYSSKYGYGYGYGYGNNKHNKNKDKNETKKAAK
ncbi:MAG: CpsD/CapB family tyrosine-protein kinase [Ruminococcaceae bacterium]|nr:CpsD/CapB family tyrosine-protein kinase [Oscillospiraceae bacterium]